MDGDQHELSIDKRCTRDIRGLARDVRDRATSDQSNEDHGGEETQQHDMNEEETRLNPSIVISPLSISDRGKAERPAKKSNIVLPVTTGGQTEVKEQFK
jgi:hypothetical protein